MGEMAEYMINGDDCSMCGVYLGEGQGFPRYCSDDCAEGIEGAFVVEGVYDD